jgi:CheY-like chemotaxis protein
MPNSLRSRLGAIFPAAAPPAPDGADPAPAREPILVVGDDQSWANECAFALRALGYDPIMAHDGAEAVELSHSHPVEIAIVDHHMPDGITLSYELRQATEARGRKLHFIMATGHATKDIAIDAMRASAADILEKPIRPAELRQALQRIRGLSDEPAVRAKLLDTMAGLRSDLARLAQLIDNPEQTPEAASHACGPVPPLPAEGSAAAPALAACIRDLLKKEAKRRAIGSGDVFGDPAWEMLLDLMLANIQDRRVSVSSACIASGAPMSTALRLVGRLVDEGVLHKIPDATDRRRHFLVINPCFEEPLREYLLEQARRTDTAKN